jgi:DNA-binding SARP family transcriptional activator
VSLSYGVLGRLEVRRDGHPLPPLPPQQRQLLCLLLLRANTAVPDDTSLHALWERSAPALRQRLFELVSRLREALGLSGGGGAIFRSSGGYELEVATSDFDVLRFEELRSRGLRLGRTRPAQAVAQLAAAEALWRGRAYLDVDDLPEFDDEIRRLQELRASCRELRLGAMLAVGRHQDVLDEVTPLARAEVLREQIQLVHLLALVRGGRTVEACRHYEWLWEQLRAERLEPGPELKHLYERIRADDPDLGDLVAPGPAPGSVPALPPAVHIALEGPAFVDRDGRAAALDRIESERRPVVVVRGEPGSGKSRLAAELVRRAHERGETVLWGRASATQAVPFQAFLRALGPLVDVEPGDDPGATLERLGSDPGRRAPTRHDLFDAIVERFRTAAVTTDVVLVLDDLQWIGDDGVALWHHLLRVQPPGVTLVATMRSTTGAAEPEWLLDRRQAGTVTEVDLAGLSAASVAELARRMGRHLPPGRAEALVAHTDGNAFFVVTLLRDGPDGPDGPGVLAGDVVASVLSTFHRLPPASQRLLEAASLAGRVACVDLLARAAGLDDPDAAVAPTIEAGILRPTRPEGPSEREVRGVDTVEFCHDIVRDAVRENLDGAHRRDLHRRLGQVREVDGHQAMGDAAELADHFQQAASGDLDRVLRYSVLAGHEALDAFAPAEAVPHYRRALDVTTLANPQDRLRRCRLLTLLGDTERAAYHLAEATPTLREAATLALDLDARAELDRSLTGLAWMHAGTPDPELCAIGDRALSLPDLPPARRARYLAARVLLAGLTVEETGRLLDEAEALVRSTPDEWCLGFVLATASLARSGPETLDWRLAAADEVRAIGERTASSELAIQSHRLLAGTRLEAGDHRRARREVDRFVEQAAGSGRPAFDAGIAQVENAMDLLHGRFAAVEDRLPRVLDGVAESPGYTAGYLVQLCWLRREQGRGAEILPPLRAAAADERFAGLRVSLAVAELEAGDPDLGARHLTQVVAGGLGSFARDSTWMATIADLATGASLADRPDLAGELYTALAPFADQLVVLSHGVVCLGSTHRFAGLAALTAGDHRRGIEHLLAALAVDEDLGAEPALARGHLALGRALSPATAGPVDPGAARRSLEEAARRAELLGMAGVQAAAGAALGVLATQAGLDLV